MIKVFYDPRQSVRENESFSPSAGKPELVMACWKETGVPFKVESFAPSTAEELCLVHDKNYVRGVLGCQIENGFGTKSREIASALPWVAGSMVAAALDAYRNDATTFSPTSGAHHAHFERGGAFCTFNFLVLAAVMAKRAGAKRVGIIDLDRHWADGTQDIIDSLKIDYIQHYSFGREQITSPEEARGWLRRLPDELFKFEGCDLLIYNAGVDVFVDDPLGGLLEAQEIAHRDHLVFSTAQTICPAIATSLAGGYCRDENGGILPILALHNQTLKEAAEALPTVDSDDSQ